MNPSGVNTKPDPCAGSSRGARPRRSTRRRTSTLTTAGPTRSAAPVTAREYASRMSASASNASSSLIGPPFLFLDRVSRLKTPPGSPTGTGSGRPVYLPPMKLAGSLAVVTGGTEGIGRAIALACGAAGARVALCARTERNVHAALRDLRADGIDAIGTTCDVSDPASVAAFATFVQRERGVPHVLINNAGIGRFKPLLELSLEDWDVTMGVNVRSLYLVT